MLQWWVELAALEGDYRGTKEGGRPAVRFMGHSHQSAFLMLWISMVKGSTWCAWHI